MIDFYEKIIELNEKEAKKSHVDTINIGLGYTSVVLKDGRCGLCCTLLDSKKSCTVYKGNEDFEDRCCYDLLLTLRDRKDCVSRAVAIALVNALNVYNIDRLPEDPGTLFDDLKVKKGDHLAMIGYFLPVVKELEKKGVIVKAYDIGKEIGDEEDFYKFVNKEADALIVTATSFINNTFPSIMEKIEGFDKPLAILGPSTIMNKSLYEGTPVSILGGTLPLDNDGILKSIRNGKGTPHLHRHSRKIYQVIK